MKRHRRLTQEQRQLLDSVAGTSWNVLVRERGQYPDEGMPAELVAARGPYIGAPVVVVPQWLDVGTKIFGQRDIYSGQSDPRSSIGHGEGEVRGRQRVSRCGRSVRALPIT